MKRKYTQTQRAKRQEQTRQRIIDALIALHQDIGPAKTTVKAVAEKAGVQRLTVYRHFPDETSLFQACTSHWLQMNPPPLMVKWSDIDDATERSRTALLLFYRYYRRTESMWNASYRDVGEVKALQAPMARFEAYLDRIRDDLLLKWKSENKNSKQLKVTLRHGLSFSTWQFLKQESLSDDKMVALVQSWIEGSVAMNLN